MLLIREIMYCKPGKVRPMVEKFVAMSAMMEKAGQGKTRVMTDLADHDLVESGRREIYRLEN